MATVATSDERVRLEAKEAELQRAVKAGQVGAARKLAEVEVQRGILTRAEALEADGARTRAAEEAVAHQAGARELLQATRAALRADLTERLEALHRGALPPEQADAIALQGRRVHGLEHDLGLTPGWDIPGRLGPFARGAHSLLPHAPRPALPKPWAPLLQVLRGELTGAAAAEVLARPWDPGALVAEVLAAVGADRLPTPAAEVEHAPECAPALYVVRHGPELGYGGAVHDQGAVIVLRGLPWDAKLIERRYVVARAPEAALHPCGDCSARFESDMARNRHAAKRHPREEARHG